MPAQAPGEAPSPAAAPAADGVRIAAHTQELLLRGRCPACAESLPPLTLLRGEACPRCGSPTGGEALPEALEERLAARWRRRAWIAVAVVGLASLAGGFVPLLQAPLFFVGMLLAHMWVVGAALGWLTPVRGAFARLTLNLLLAVLGVVDLVIAVAVVPAVGASGPVLGLTGAAGLAVYLAIARGLIRSRLSMDRQGLGLQLSEWGPPVGAFVGFVTVVGGAVAVLVLALRWLSQLSFVQWLGDLLGGA